MNYLDDLQHDLLNDLRQLNCNQIFVGYSGGVDSTLLLALACQAFKPDKVTAIHVHHGLSEHADHWLAHCEKNSAGLGCRFVAKRVNVASAGQGIEAQARSERYRIFKELLPAQAGLLLGQHLDDQVETFFLRLLRGAGPHGLQAMSQVSNRDHYQIVRPFLSTRRETIEDLAQRMNLSWIEDDSNQSARFDRNFLRLSVLPVIEERWPKYRERIEQTIGLLDSPKEVQDSFDISAELKHRLSYDSGLKLVQIDQFSNAQLLSILHAWIVSLGLQVPSKQRLQSILDSVVYASRDSQPSVSLGDGTIRRHGPALYWVPDFPSVSEPPNVTVNQWQEWSGVGRVKLEEVTDNDIALKPDLPDLNWRIRQGGEKLRPYGRSKRRDLKRLLQEYRVKPWLRDRIPLLFSGENLIAVGNELISAEHICEKTELGLRVSWQNPEISD